MAFWAMAVVSAATAATASPTSATLGSPVEVTVAGKTGVVFLYDYNRRLVELILYKFFVQRLLLASQGGEVHEQPRRALQELGYNSLLVWEGDTIVITSVIPIICNNQPKLVKCFCPVK